ncbi:MAG TPA: hypothetical protein GXX14_10900 [Clostridiaceae bacterium]|nr:hypothetical protein [Clostridiaceae bacterium]
MRINNNIMAMNTHRQLGINNAATSKSLEKLSSGYRINRAGDDAAGLSISEKMRAQIRGLNMASRNAQDGISLIQTAEGALQETQAILQRMRELAVQASNDTNVQIDREALQREIEQLKSEIDRIGNDTEFNTQKLLKGGSTGRIEVTNVTPGVSPGPTPAKAATGTLEGITFTAKTEGSAGNSIMIVFSDPGSGGQSLSISVAGNTITVNLATDGSSNVTSTVDDIVSAINGDGGASALVTASGSGTSAVNAGNVTLSGGEDAGTTTGTVGEITFSITENFVAGDKITINGITYTAIAEGETAGEREFAVGATVDATAANLLAAIEDADDDVDDAASDVSGSAITLVQAAATTASVPFEPEVKADFSAIFQIGANENQTMEIEIGDMRVEALGIQDISLATGEDARAAITTINDAINKVSTQRSELGAFQNRLEHTIRNLDTSAENLQASESRIRDVDMAKEMMEFTKQSILQQAATAMLAQANQAPQGILQLLR